MFENSLGITVCEEVTSVTVHNNKDYPSMSGYLYSFRVYSKELDTTVMVVHPERFSRHDLEQIFNKVLEELKKDSRYPIIDDTVLYNQLKKQGFSEVIHGICSCCVATVNPQEKESLITDKKVDSGVQATLL